MDMEVDMDMEMDMEVEVDKIKGNKMINLYNIYNQKYVIIRTYSAGVFYGIVEQYDDKTVLLKNARRMREWKNLGKEISLTGISILGVHPESVIERPVNEILLQWIEILPCTEESIATFTAQPAATVN